ncbi:tRNA (adenosine(37)-N6)-threonylcarbamoyltransferase complex ATPase subunit type 1 TsaE [Anaerotruncus rubiinfantis]|uniref:tRNA (adenosine(37)-N6)-threonylcarbamoyltransferase complex ATPase subunit type 1 TsaE n=1 Tax=Anaerotruncus rubiinfantis TaxID=1720200 RepID=UPI003D7959AD
MITFTSHSTAETEQFAAGFAAELRPGDVVACRGGMGMGKTAFARGLARGLGLVDDVSSPTFALVHEYTNGNISLYHFDMYRVSGFDELYSTGFFDYLDQGGVLFIEWSENIESALPPGTIALTLARIDDNTREITIEGERF